LYSCSSDIRISKTIEDKSTNPGNNIAEMVQLATQGSGTAVDLLFPLLYDDLHQVARAFFANENSDHTLQPTAIVHELYIKLIRKDGLHFQNRVHFMALCAVLMRRVLVDHARSKGRSKRGGRKINVEFADDIASMVFNMEQMLDLERALGKLETLDPRQARIVELRFFGGLSMDEVAELIGVSMRTAESDWCMARAWLKRELTGQDT
jgi:RNA polymerase sigma-70 factor (ECF subfamily)